MTIPALLLGFIVSSFYGSLFHLWRNGGLGRFFLYMILSWIGFWLGHFIANVLSWSFLSVGPLHLGLATVTCFLVLQIGHWLSLPGKKNTGVG